MNTLKTWDKQNAPINLIEISATDLKKYKKLKKGDEIKKNDILEIFEGIYAQISDDNILSKRKVADHNIFFRKA